MEQKRCSNCGELKPLSEFHKHRGRKDGLRSQCKTCCLAYATRYREANREELAAFHRRYREAHPEKCAASDKRWYEANRERDATKHKRWVKANREKEEGYRQQRRAHKLVATVEAFDIMKVWERDGYTCVYCGSTDHLGQDHIMPLSRGGAHSPDNLCIACRSCNSSKHDKPLGEWIWQRFPRPELAVAV